MQGRGLPSLDIEPYLRILRWFLEAGETLRVLALPDQLDALGPLSAIVSGAKEKLAAARDKVSGKGEVTDAGSTEPTGSEALAREAG